MELFPLLTVNRKASGAIAAYRIVNPTAADGTVEQSNAAADKVQGVSGQLGAADGGRIDIHYAGIVPVTYGGAVTPGDPLTSDASGRAVVAVAGNKTIGTATEGGAADEIGAVLLHAGVAPAS